MEYTTENMAKLVSLLKQYPKKDQACSSVDHHAVHFLLTLSRPSSVPLILLARLVKFHMSRTGVAFESPLILSSISGKL